MARCTCPLKCRLKSQSGDVNRVSRARSWLAGVGRTLEKLIRSFPRIAKPSTAGGSVQKGCRGASPDHCGQPGRWQSGKGLWTTSQWVNPGRNAQAVIDAGHRPLPNFRSGCMFAWRRYQQRQVFAWQGLRRAKRPGQSPALFAIQFSASILPGSHCLPQGGDELVLLAHRRSEKPSPRRPISPSAR